MTKMSLELQVGFEPTPCRLRVGCSTTEATAAYCRSFPAVRETSKVCVVLLEKKGTNAFAVQAAGSQPAALFTFWTLPV